METDEAVGTLGRWEHHRLCSSLFAAPYCDCYAEQEALLEIILWMSGAPAFGPGGEAHEAFIRDVQPLLLSDKPAPPSL